MSAGRVYIEGLYKAIDALLTRLDGHDASDNTELINQLKHIRYTHLDALPERIDALEKANETLSKNAKTARRDVDVLETKLFECRAERDRSERYSKSLEKHITTLINLPEKARDLVYVLRTQQGLESKLEEKQKEVERLKVEYREEFDRQMAKVHEQYSEQLKDISTELELRLKTARQEEAASRELNGQLKAEINSLQKTLSITEFKLTHVEKERDDMKQQIVEMQKLAETHQNRLSETNESRMQLLYEISKSKSETEYFKAQLERESARNQELLQEVKSMNEEKNALLTEKVPKLEVQIGDLLNTRFSLQQRVSELQSENSKLGDSHRKLEDKVLRYSILEDTKGTANIEAGNEFEELRRRYSRLSAEHDDLIAKLATRDGEITRLQEECGKLEREKENSHKRCSDLEKKWEEYQQQTREEVAVLQTRMQREAEVWHQGLMKKESDRCQAQMDELVKTKDKQISALENQVQELRRKEQDQLLVNPANDAELNHLKSQCEALKRSQLQMRKMLNSKAATEADSEALLQNVKNLLSPALTLALIHELRAKQKLPQDAQ